MAKTKKTNPSAEQESESAAVWVKLDDLTPWDKNPRKNDEAVREVAKSIKRFGFGSPIIARKADGEIIAGHTRLRAARALGLDKVPVRYLDLDPAEAHLLSLADNKIGEIAEWDDEAVADILKDYSLGDAKSAGWDLGELDKLLAQDTDDDIDVDIGDETKLDESFAVVVTCQSEEEQLRVLEWCESEGLKCRALI